MPSNESIKEIKEEPITEDLTCVIGMHRSGTSLTAQICHELGLPVVGPEDFLRQGNQFNPGGYWETSALVTINRRILYALGGDWNVAPSLSPYWWHKRRLGPLKKRAQGFVKHTAAPRATWKDPRMTLLLPFWQPLLPPTRYILCLRNPLNVAASLARRDGMPRDQALNLWMLYTAHGLLDTLPERPLLMFYEDLVGPEHSSQVQRLASFVGTSRAGVPLQGVIRPDYAHGEHGWDAPLNDPEVSSDVRALWSALVDWHTSHADRDLDTARDIAAAFTPRTTPWKTAQRYRMNFWARQIKMQLLEEWEQ